MGADELKQALDDCIINFDAQVLVTDLLQDYQMAYEDVDKILKQHIADEEKKGTKFEKRFLVSGEDEATTNEIYKVVDSEKELEEWLRKLKNAESALYSVEVAGGAKRAADIFTPMRWCPIQLDNIKTRAPLKTGASTANGNESSVSVKTEIKAETKKPKSFDFAANTNKQTTATESNNKFKIPEKDIKKSPTAVEKPKTPKKQTTPEDQKSTPTTKGNAKKGIASFFGPAKNDSKSKKTSGVVKPPTPKKMQDFFKKSEKISPPTPKAQEQEKITNKSMQLFENEDDEDAESDIEHLSTQDSANAAIDVDMSDDEAELEALRKKCSEENELDESASSSNAAKKRRRIIDSDDEDDDDGEPQVKHEKKETDTEENSAEIEKAGTAKSETFLDEDGFVITIKAKTPAATRKPTKTTSPKKSSPKKELDKKPAKTTPKAAAKTKQGKIMSFFTKKGY